MFEREVMAEFCNGLPAGWEEHEGTYKCKACHERSGGGFPRDCTQPNCPGQQHAQMADTSMHQEVACDECSHRFRLSAKEVHRLQADALKPLSAEEQIAHIEEKYEICTGVFGITALVPKKGTP